jgi:hypothetical protein
MLEVEELYELSNFQMDQVSLNASSENPARTHLYRDLIRKPALRVREGMAILCLGICHIREPVRMDMEERYNPCLHAGVLRANVL